MLAAVQTVDLLKVTGTDGTKKRKGEIVPPEDLTLHAHTVPITHVSKDL